MITWGQCLEKPIVVMDSFIHLSLSTMTPYIYIHICIYTYIYIHIYIIIYIYVHNRFNNHNRKHSYCSHHHHVIAFLIYVSRSSAPGQTGAEGLGCEQEWVIEHNRILALSSVAIGECLDGCLIGFLKSHLWYPTILKLRYC